MKKGYLLSVGAIMVFAILAMVATNVAFSASKRKICLKNSTDQHADIKDVNQSWIFDLLPGMEECFKIDSTVSYVKRFIAYKHDTEEIISSYDFELTPGEEKVTWEIMQN